MPQTTTRLPKLSGADSTGPSAIETPRAHARTAGEAARGRIRAAIVHDLSGMERLCLMLWHAEGMSPEEIGCVMDLTPAQVSALHERIVERLRRGTRAA